MDDEKVSVNINAIENGFIVSRSWCEKTKGKDSMMNYNHHSEQFFMKSLPPMLAKMFNKGSAKMFEDNNEEKNPFKKATDDWIKSQQGKKEEKKDE